MFQKRVASAGSVQVTSVSSKEARSARPHGAGLPPRLVVLKLWACQVIQGSVVVVCTSGRNIALHSISLTEHSDAVQFCQRRVCEPGNAPPCLIPNIYKR